MERNVLPVLDFFDRLSDSYDQMISWPTRIGAEGTFFKRIVTDYKLKSSLDVACSTGFHVILCRRLGLDAVGLDASPRMIEKARANSVTCGVTVDYILGDVTNLSRRFSEGFDIITCMGDTIPHFKSKKEVLRAFEEIHKCLSSGGLFVLHNRNYDHVMRTCDRFMPPTGSRNGTEETLFFRMLDFSQKSLNYNVVKFHRRENKWESSVQTTEIYPYYKNDLESMLKAVGFKKLEFYGNFNFEDYDKNGTDLIIIAEKKGVLKSNQKRKPFTVTRSAKVKADASKSVAKKAVTVSKPRGRPSKTQGR
jgi:glycine/sarcosine N-methyltransferase